jgi:tetratricopeptide (TPR) repeat protein
VRCTALRCPHLALLALGGAWVAGAEGVIEAPWSVIITVVVAAGLALPALRRRKLPAPQAWLAGLLAWAALDAVLRPVASFDAARLVAMGVTALLLAGAGSTPRGAAWGRAAVVVAGLGAAAWLVVERALSAERPGGPFSNPNLGATVALLALAMVPFVPVARGLRAAGGCLAAAGIVASGSRAALLGACTLAVIWGLAGRTRRWRVLGAALALVGVGGLTLRLLVDRDPLRFERLRIWGVAAKTIAAELPLGCGPGGYADAAAPHNFPLEGYARYARTPDLAESDLLEALATLGLPGAVLLLGLIASVASRLPRRDGRGWGVVGALAVTSAFSTQLIVPVVAWPAALALAAVLPRGRPRARVLAWPLGVCVGTAVVVAATAVLALSNWGVGEAPARAVERAMSLFRSSGTSDTRMADAEALLVHACSARSRYGRAWRCLGTVRLQRAVLRRDRELAASAARAFSHARRLSGIDAWAAYGEGEALGLAGDLAGAEKALEGAVTLEPNFVGAWLRIGRLRLDQGRVAAARDALAHAETARRRARGADFVSDYERSLASVDRVALRQLRLALGVSR